jgi:hypothetical protein
MATPSKHPLKTEEEGKKQDNHLLTDFFKRRRLRRPKKKGNLASDRIIIAKQGLTASAAKNKPMMHEASKALKRKIPPSKVLLKVKKAQANYRRQPSMNEMLDLEGPLTAMERSVGLSSFPTFSEFLLTP